ncbi:hypothetical protein H2199_006723 [Coniosporium tulheliwenetii]|uniref:Uncharacterized protein n=1 Tax=Coniosporium tulheliwenetii TaxID=3383036 RepID=A0ACC2YU32_9PEZI|nr:hypothetical protein H2199_006723 [Cladosporium sp. JES 115]
MNTRSVSGVTAMMVSQAAPTVAVNLIQILTWGTRSFMARRLNMNTRLTRNEPQTISIPLDLPDLCRLEGINLLQLPPQVAAAKVAIPTRFAATAAYLVQHGRSATGTFRIPGKQRVITSLYNHFTDHAKAAEASDSYIELTIRASTLPSAVSFDMHDIASTFKKFLAELPGGIIGSLRLFDAIRYIMTLKYDENENLGPNEVSTNAKYIAFSLLKLESSHRLALISAVFGLLAYLAEDASISSPHPSSRESSEAKTNTGINTDATERMSPHALAVVFAPLLLGNLTDMIRLDTSSSLEDLDTFIPSFPSACSPCDSPTMNNRSTISHTSTYGRSYSPTFTQLYSQPFEETSPLLLQVRGAATMIILDVALSSLEASLRRTHIAAAVLEMMLKHWRGIVAELRRSELGTTGCYLPWPSAPNPPKAGGCGMSRVDSGPGA